MSRTLVFGLPSSVTGSVEAWSFCATWYAKAIVARPSGLSKPKNFRLGDGILSTCLAMLPSGNAISSWMLLHGLPLIDSVIFVRRGFLTRGAFSIISIGPRVSLMTPHCPSNASSSFLSKSEIAPI